MYADGFLPVEIVAEHIAAVEVVVIEIRRKLILAAFVVGVSYRGLPMSSVSMS